MTALKPEIDSLEGIENYKFGWSDPDVYATARRARAVGAGRPQHQRAQERAAVDARPAAQGPEALHARSPCPPGVLTCRASTSTTSSTSCAPPRRWLPRWDDLPEDIKRHVRQARHPGGGEAAAGLRRRGPVRVRGRLPQDPRGPRAAGRHLRRHRHGAARARGALPRVLHHRHPDR